MVTSKMKFLNVFRNLKNQKIFDGSQNSERIPKSKISDIKNFQFVEKKEIPLELEKEILILYELGLEDYEIEYLIYLKTKQIASQKWE